MNFDKVLEIAVTAAGPMGDDLATWRDRVEAAAVEVSILADDKSPLQERVAKVMGSAKFVGVITGVKVEETSTRGVVRINTGQVTRNCPDGIETIRTERGDSVAGAQMIELAKRLKNHRVLVYKAMETSASDPNVKVRVLVHLIDLGEARESGPAH
jgi:hypothetical protein